jgi:hypothetical protein
MIIFCRSIKKNGTFTFEIKNILSINANKQHESDGFLMLRWVYGIEKSFILFVY